MGLITKEVKIGLGGSNIKYYENLGYKIPKENDNRGRLRTPNGTKILVKTKDLQNNSSAKVDIECDDCGKKIKDIPWQAYIKYIHNDGKYYCKNCAMKLYGSENLSKSLLNKNGKSFEQWCLDNDRQDVLNRWDYDLNNKKPSEICYGTNKKYYFKCPRNIHKSELKQISNLVNNQEGSIKCNKCNSFAQWGIDNLGENFLEKYWDYEKNININPWKISHASGKYIYIKCQEKDYHGSYPIQCRNFINGNRCPECQCPKGEERISNYFMDKGFIKIDQKEFDQLINQNKYNKDYFVPQKEFNGLIGLSGGLLSYDFYIPNLNLLIEYDGEFHFKPIKNYKNESIKFAEKRLKKQQEHDKRKNEYAKINNIKLLRIPYWDFNNIELILQKELNL
jgi:hypothetical protein